MNKQTNSRKIYLDIVRILAVALVLYTHISADGLRLYRNLDRLYQQIPYLFIDCFRTINNPLLFMVSGALLLGKEEPIRTVWRKRMFRMVVVLVVFTYIHALDSCIMAGDLSSFDMVRIFRDLLAGPIRTSYWFLYSYISYLIILPFLRIIARNMRKKGWLLSVHHRHYVVGWL